MICTPTASAGWSPSLVVGVLITVVAAYGYKFVARVANIAAPWMVLVFIAFGIIGLRQMGVTVDQRLLAAGAVRDLEGWRPAARPGQVHLLARHVLRLVLQHGHAHRHVRPVGAPLRPEILVCDRLRSRHVPRPLHGLDCRVGPLRAATAPESGRHRRAAGTAGVQRLRHRGLDLRDRGRLDNGQPDHLPRRPRVSGHCSARVPLPR